MINARLPDVLPPAFSWPQHIPQTLPGHMEKVGKRGHKTICIPAESAGNVWKSIQIRAFNSFASERSRVRIPSGPPSRGYKKDIARENPDYIGVFTVLYGKISATDFVDVNRSFSLYVRFWTLTQPNIRYARQIEIKNLSAFFITLKKRRNQICYRKN